MPVIVSKEHQMLVAPRAGTEALFPNEPAGPPIPDDNDFVTRNVPSILLAHNVANTLLLRKLGHVVPSPMRMYYDYPGPAGQPAFGSQIDTAQRMSENQRFYNLNDKGTGKTRCALWAWDFLRQTGGCSKMLVVAPLSTLHFTWAAEAFKLFGDKVKVQVLHGSQKAKARKARLRSRHLRYQP